MTELTNLSTRLSELRKDIRDAFGGIIYTPITKDFGIYRMNIPTNGDLCRHAEHHFVELEKMMEAVIASEYTAKEEK